MAGSPTNFSVQIPKTITHLFLSYAKIHHFLFVCLCNSETEKQLSNGVLYLPSLFYISCMQSQGKRCWHPSTGQCMAPFSCHPDKVPCIVSSKFAPKGSFHPPCNNSNKFHHQLSADILCCLSLVNDGASHYICALIHTMIFQMCPHTQDCLQYHSFVFNYGVVHQHQKCS